MFGCQCGRLHMSRRSSSFCRGTDVLEEGAALDEPMAKLLTVLPWTYVGGGEEDPRR